LVARRVVEVELEHRLHQRHELGIGREPHAVELTHGRGHGQVRQVHRDQVDGVRHQPPVEGPQVDPLEIDGGRTHLDWEPGRLG